MGKKKAFVLRLDEEMYAKLERWAADEFRSANGQVEWIIREALKKSGRLKVDKSDSSNPPIADDTTQT